MALFKKKPKKIYPKQTFRIYLTESGKTADPVIETADITDDSEFLCIWRAEKQFYPRLKVARTEKIGEVWPDKSEN